MKFLVYVFHLAIIGLFTFAFHVTELSEAGRLHNPLLRNHIQPWLRTLSGMATNLKFRIRGPEPVKNKIVIVEIDSPSLEALGRWPWHRDTIAYLIEKTFESGAKIVGLDIVFSEQDPRVPEELKIALTEQGLSSLADQAESDPMLTDVIHKYRDRLVLGWTSDMTCQPTYDPKERCPVSDQEMIQYFPEGIEKFAVDEAIYPKAMTKITAIESTPIVSLYSFIANIDPYNKAALYAGSFNAFPDPDSFIRRTWLTLLADGKPYPVLGLEMARVGLNETVKVEFDETMRIEKISFARSQREIPVSPIGTMDINFRGPAYHFTYVSALEVMGDEPILKTGIDRSLASLRDSLFKDAYVLIGVTALGVFDIRAFPFDSNTPGVEGHANILDNILSGDMLLSGLSTGASRWLFAIMTIGALVFGFLVNRLESIPALLLALSVASGLGTADQKFFFEGEHVNLNTSLLYIELFSLLIFTLAVKYVIEERNRKFVKNAFAKYVSPAIVDMMLKDPSKLTVGGEKRELTVLFSDIRGFTTFSEKMDAKQLAQFLNRYLSQMTDIVFENEGTLDKYIGDAVMAFWGAPMVQKNHATNACKTAVKMQRKLAEIRETFHKDYGIEVEIGIGLNTGTVNVGNMGSEKIFEYTVIGDHVNLASRLEGLTKTYGTGIITTRFTLDAVEASGDPLPPHRVLDTVKVKGKKMATELIELLDEPLPELTVDLFNEGRKLYLARQWDAAIISFQKANQETFRALGRNDETSLMYVKRCQEFKLNPPEADWDVCWKMSSK